MTALITKLSRRSALVLFVTAIVAPALSAAGVSGRVDGETESAAWFRERLGDRFVFSATDASTGVRIQAELVNVAEMPRSGRRVQPFSLLFFEVAGGSAGNAYFAMAHADAALPTVFMGRILNPSQGAYHEVIFN